MAILIIAAFLRLYQFTDLPPGLYPDEAMNGNNALEALRAGEFKVFYPENNGREGLFINIQALFLKFLMPLFGGNPEPWMLRLPSALFGILTVLGIYFLTKEILNKNTALLASFLLATSFWHINFSRIGFRAIMAPFFLAWALYFLLKALDSILRTSDAQKFNWKFSAIIGGLLYGLGFYTYISYRATPLLILVIFVLYWFSILRTSDVQKLNFTRKKFLFSIFCFLLSAIIVAAPLGLYFLDHPRDFFGRAGQISIFESPALFKDLGLNILKTAGMFNISGDWNWRHNIAGRPLLFWPVGVLFLIGIIIGLVSIFKNPKSEILNPKQIQNSNLFRASRFEFWVLFSWLIIAALPVIISNEALPHALRSILMVPPVFILAALGGIWLIEKIKNQISKIKKANQGSKILKFIIHTPLFIILSLLVFEAYTAYFIKWAKNPNTADAFSADYVKSARELNSLPKTLPKYVVVEASGVDVRGIPMPAQTVMFITDTFSPENQKEKNIYYILPWQINQIPENAIAFSLP
jgi:4-amino-4-deoxy-L-arabinose transferase-like glycosyltransferase